MKKFVPVFCLVFLSFFTVHAQYRSSLTADHWVDSVFNSLSNEQRIAQLMIIRAHSNLGSDHVAQVTELINKYNVGGLCFFQGGPVRQANLTNFYQAMAKTPLMISIDGEWGLGMRLDSVINFPRQLMIGAVPDAAMVYQVGRAIGEQCKRLGIHVNFAPDVDINNNPENPVINDRSFGEDKYKVALFGIQYMKGMQDVGVMACAKHFPGHGDVAVDSHYDLPIINKTREQLDSLELYPFRELIKEGVGSVMIAHLYIPSIDTTANQATSLSYNNVTRLLKEELQFQGLTITDGLEMKGVTKFYPDGQASVQSLIAGNDLLCLPGDIPGSIAGVLQAIENNQLTWSDLNNRVRKVLLAKYNLGLNEIKPIETTTLVADLNVQTKFISEMLARNTITILRKQQDSLLPLKKKGKVAYLAIGIDSSNAFGSRLQKDLNADSYFFNYIKDRGTVNMMASTLKEKYDAVLIGMHNYSRRPANNFGLSDAALELVNMVQTQMPAVTFAFGNPYAIRNIENAPNLVAGYEDIEATHHAAADLLLGTVESKGELPVTVTDSLPFGTGNKYNHYFTAGTPETVGLSSTILQAIDSIANDAIAQGATPGCVVLVARKGKIAFEKSYGYTTYDKTEPVTNNTIYDLASVTKISATTLAVMKLYEQGRLDLNKTLGYYLPWVKGSNKANIVLRNLLIHQARLVAYIPFYRETTDSLGVRKPGLYSPIKTPQYSVRVAEDMYMRNDYTDTLYKRILDSKLEAPNKYVYSDNDFIFLGKVVEAITGQNLNDYTREQFYIPLRMMTTSFKPTEHYPLNAIAPTEYDKTFRAQLLRGDVHDPGAAMFGGIAGHAGLFSNAYDLVQLYQLLLNGGELNGVRLLKKKTIDLFTGYHSKISRRGLGFDKPEKDNKTRKEPYPTLSASPKTYGHTGYTGTCVWVDPTKDLVYIFLSNRVSPVDQPKLLRMNVRGKIHEVIYKAIQKK